MSWSGVRDWRDRLRQVTPPAFGLSRPGADLAWQSALAGLGDDALQQASQIQGRPYSTAGFIAASTVFTAPLEWCALLLGHGTRVALKLSSQHESLVAPLQQTAHDSGLPLYVSTSADDAIRADLLIAMGNNNTIAELKRQRGRRSFLGFGHRFSAAWIENAWDDVALDLAIHDGYGCMSPVVVFTPRPLGVAADQLAEALDAVQKRIPIGPRAPAELAAIRARGALAQVTGTVRSGSGWSVHGLPANQWTPGALPRSIAVCSVADRASVRRILKPHQASLSVMADAQDHLWGTARVTRPGRMQRPPLDRIHDGVSVLRAVVQPGEAQN